MLRRFVVMALVLVASAVGLTAVGTGEASAANPTTIVWGASYGGQKKLTSSTIYSPSGGFKLAFQSDGNFVAYRRAPAPSGGTTFAWYAYWASHTQSKGKYLWLQTNGDITVRSAAGASVWGLGKWPGTQFNYELTIANDGNVAEYYSSGNPTTSTHKLVWQNNRHVSVRTCTGLPLGGGTTTASAVVFGGANLAVTIRNNNVLPLTVRVERYFAKQNVDTKVGVIPPYGSKKFTGFYHLDNGPETASFHITNSADSIVASWAITGLCWYKA